MTAAYQTDRRQSEAPTAAPAAPEEAAPEAQTTFLQGGPRPAVAALATTAPPSASETAYGPTAAAPAGPGVQALEALIAKGAPAPAAVVDVIDAHRGEHAALLALVQAKLGNDFVAQVETSLDRLRASVARKEIVDGDPGDPNSGYFVASQAQQGAKWRTADGGFTGTIDKKGLDSKIGLDGTDDLHAKIGADKTGSLAWEHGGVDEGEIYGSYKSGTDYEAGVRRPWDLGTGTLTTGLHHKAAADGATDGAFGSYKSKDGALTADGALGVKNGAFAGSASATDKLSAHDTLTGSVAHDDKGTSLAGNEVHTWDGGSFTTAGQLHAGPTGTTGSLSGAYTDHGIKADGSVTRALTSTSLHLGASDQVSKELSLSGHAEEMIPDHGQAQTTLGLSEKYRSGKVIEGLDLEAGHGARDYLKATGSLDAQLAPNLYGGAWGSYSAEAGKQSTAQLGASLTLTSSEKTALTLAGILDQNGGFETRLQLDVFQSKLNSVSDLADHKKDAMVSLFVSFKEGGGNRALDDRFGAPQAQTGLGDPQVMAGVRFKF